MHEGGAGGAADDFIMLVEADMFEGDDALIGPGFAFPHRQHRGLRADGIP